MTMHADLEKAEAEFTIAESAYRLKLAQLLAVAKTVLAANVPDSGVKSTDKGKG
jgi:hypothetical protein